MSHLIAIKAEVKDLNAVKAACKRLGLEFVEGKKTYVWYGRSVGDYPLPEGMKKEDLGKCSHVIKSPKSTYELGLVRNPATGGYRLAFDFWGPGVELQKAVCNYDEKGNLDSGCGKFLQAYAAELTIQNMRKKGWMVTEKKVGESVRLTVSCA